jgi:hypothetical protein
MRASASGREGVVAQAGAIQLIEDELLDRFGSQARQQCRVSDAGADFLVDGQGERLQQRRLADEHQVMRTGKVLAEQAQFAQAVGGHEVGVVNDGHEHLAGAMDAEGLLDQQAFAVMVAALELDLEGFAEDAQGVVISVQRAVDHGRDHAFGIVRQERLFEDAFAGSRAVNPAQNDSQSILRAAIWPGSSVSLENTSLRVNSSPSSSSSAGSSNELTDDLPLIWVPMPKASHVSVPYDRRPLFMCRIV